MIYKDIFEKKSKELAFIQIRNAKKRKNRKFVKRSKRYKEKKYNSYYEFKKK